MDDFFYDKILFYLHLLLCSLQIIYKVWMKTVLCVPHRTEKQEVVQKTSTVIRLSSTPLRYQKNSLHFF